MALEAMTEQEYAEQEQSMGARVHLHRGVWWREVYPFYYKPVFEVRELSLGESSPSAWRSLLGYSHVVKQPASGNRSMEYMVMSGVDLASFALNKLRDAKRAQVRKGLRSLTIRELEAADPVLEDLRAINIAQANRQQAKSGFGLAADYYTQHRREWEDEHRRLFALPKRGKWGAFAEGKLVAYAVAFIVADTGFISAVKSHTDYLHLCSNDALYFTFLESLRATGMCTRVFNGAPSIPSLNRFKEQFLFQPTSLGVYTHGLWLREIGLSATSNARKVRASVQAASAKLRLLRRPTG